MLTALEQAKPGYVAWLLHNPADGDADLDDMTILRCMQFSASWGYLRTVIVNVYPFRTPSPAACRAWLKAQGPGDWQMCNLEEIQEAGMNAGIRMVAWGSGPIDIDWRDQCVDTFEGLPTKPLHILGLSPSHMPLHPMARGKWRVPSDRQPIHLVRY